MRSFRHKLLVLAVPMVIAAAAAGQQSILFSMDHSGHTTNGGAGIALLHVNDQDINLVTPSAAGPYFARKFYNVAAWRCMLGDSNGAPGALSYANGAPVSEVDSIQLAPDANLSDGVQLSDLWVSFNDNVSVVAASGVPLVEEGDLVQFLPGGAIVKRVTRAQINTLINQPVATPCDVDGFGISAAGDAFWSESQNVGPVQDGCIWTAPAGTWNTTGFAQPSGAFLILIETEASALIANATGGAFTSLGDLKGVEIDPNGGTWTATRRKVIGGVITTIDTAQVPNLIFSASQIGATLFTTANGGSVAVVNGVTMGGPPWNNTTLGPAIGIAASPATPTLGDFALIPAQTRPLLSDYTYTTISGADPLGNSPTPGILSLDLGDTAPFGFVNLVVSTALGWGIAPAGQRFLSVPISGYDFNDLYFPDLLDPLVQLTFLSPSFTYATDQHGYANVVIGIPPGLSGLAAVLQPIDVVALRLGGPAPLYFQ